MKKKNAIPFKPKPFSLKSKAKQRTAEDALAGMRTLPIPALVTTINMMIGVLSERGFQIYNWDNKDKAVYKLVFRGGKSTPSFHTLPKGGCLPCRNTRLR